MTDSGSAFWFLFSSFLYLLLGSSCIFPVCFRLPLGHVYFFLIQPVLLLIQKKKKKSNRVIKNKE